jgi:hypothetical protein
VTIGVGRVPRLAGSEQRSVKTRQSETVDVQDAATWLVTW